MTVTNKAAFDVLTAQEYNDLIALARPVGAIKPTDQSNATTTLADDAALQVTLASGTTYKYKGWFLANAGTAVDVKFSHSVPAGVSGWWTIKNQTVAGAAETAWQNSATWGSTVTMEGNAGDKVFESFGVIATGATGGLLKVQFAANAAGTAIMRAYSMIEFLAQ
jgi:hypothetical protein